MSALLCATLSFNAKDPAEVTLLAMSILSLTTIFIELVSLGFS